ncbi:hypothetical protein N7481_008982 [Penicillium waksmanii]|uniref:uncharacterized protein n=1 Tax=Penicillium waksmanii TaxID=69791 RepID=UPI002548DE26|nr:uncharacterized protein N7481_008982 [Penicillium waksmanii]KAJ5975275.1 hypothetical protein N7481_008982 [Penicillium waksmanii]
MLNWDSSSTETPDQQRSRLVTKFLNIDILPLEWFQDQGHLLSHRPRPPLPITEENNTYILIAGEEAFRSGSLLVLYLDGFRRVVRGGRIDQELDDIANIVGIWMCTADIMGYPTVSERYRVNGDLGRELYQLTEELLADP